MDENNKACKPGQTGKILLTQLKNLAMPLIRYEIGDMACQGSADECEIGLPIIKRIEGRVRNLVVMPNGDTFHPVFDETKILNAAPVKRYQVIQKDINNIEINIEGQAFSEAEETALKNVFSETFKNAFKFSIIYHENIPFANRHKFELFKTEVRL